MTTVAIFNAVVPLDDLKAADQSRSGGKAFNCARLRQAGFPVPDGLVVLSSATDDDVAAVSTHPWFERQPAHTLFAVRSSGVGEDGARESFAGIHQTLLNVGRGELREAVVACRSSARSAQALEYRGAMRIATDAAQMGVLIQRMITPVAAGVAFSINPVTGAADEIVVNSSWGLGESLVSGQIDPDEFVAAKRDGALRWMRIGDKGQGGDRDLPSLDATAIRELARIVADIERDYGTPQDVEWCHDGTTLWIVQTRPVTTCRASTEEIEWTRANVGEVMPDVTSPQALAFFETLLDTAERRYMGSVAAPEGELGPIVKSFHGRLYFNLTQLRRICEVGGVAPAVMLKSMGHAGAIQPSDETTPPPSLETVRHLPALLRITRMHMRAERIIREHDQRTREYLARFGAVDPHALDDVGLWAVIEQWAADAPEYLQPVILLGGVLFHEAPVRKACARVGVPFEDLVYPQLAAGVRSVSTQQAFDLEALAAMARREPAVFQYLSSRVSDVGEMRSVLQGSTFLAEFERFLEKYGHRGRYEYDWSLPRYAEDPSPLLHSIRVHLEAPAGSVEEGADAQRERNAVTAWASFERRLTRWQKWTMLPAVRKSIAKMKRYYVWREQVRSDLVRLLVQLRAWHLVLAGRFVERGWLDERDDYFLLRMDEIGEVLAGQRDPGTICSIVCLRRAEQERLGAIQMPLLMKPSELPALIRTAGVSGGSDADRTLEGQPVSGGRVEADVVVVRDPGDFGRMKRGAILVARATDPSWTPLFTLASGVVVEVGGVLSHASTIAREYGLPALANVRHATRRLRTGERVQLDANLGLVHRLASPRPPSEAPEVVQAG